MSCLPVGRNAEPRSPTHGDNVWSMAVSVQTGSYVASASATMIFAAGVVTIVPFALLTALAWFAWWPPHWLEPIVLFGLPVMCIPWMARSMPPAYRRHMWGGMIFLATAWYLASPHLTPGGDLSIGSQARIFAAEIELLIYGGMAWSDSFRLAAFATAGVAAIAAVGLATWYTLSGLQWMGERAASNAPARPVSTLSDAAWAGRAEVKDRFSTPGGIVLGELTDPRRKIRFDPRNPGRWGRQGKGPLITLDPAAGNAHSLVFSGSGSFKTAGIAIPNALTFAGSLIVIDPKSEIHALTGPVRARRGRLPWLITSEDGLDPIRLLTAACPNDGTVFTSIAEFLLPTSGDDKSDSSAFFHEKAVRLLAALLAHLHYADSTSRDSEKADLFLKASRMLALAPDVLRDEFRTAASEHADSEERAFIHVDLAEVANTEDRQLSGVTATVANGLAWVGHSSTRGFLASRRADGKALLDRVLDPGTDIYLAIPTPVLQSNPGIARVLIGSLVRVLRDSAMDPKRKGSITRRLFLIDEARALRRMDTLAAVRDEGRAYGIHLLQIFQSWQQVLECYGHHGAGAWANSVDAMVIGPVSDARQAQELSRMVGRHTVTTSSASRQRSGHLFMPFSGTSGSSESSQLRELELIQPSELRQLPPEAAIILAAGTPPIMASKAIWFTRTDMREMVERAKIAPEPEELPSTGTPCSDALIAEDGSAGLDVPDSPSPGPLEEQGEAIPGEGAGAVIAAAAGQGWFQKAMVAAVRMLRKGPESGSMPSDDTDDGEGREQPRGGNGDGADGLRRTTVSPGPGLYVTASFEVNMEDAGNQPAGDNEDIPEDDCPTAGDDSHSAADPDQNSDERTVEEDGVVVGAECDQLETVQDAPTSAMDVVAEGIVNRALYTAIVQRSQPVSSHAFVEAVLDSPGVEIPPGTSARVIQPMALGTGVEHADDWSLVFVPDDGSSPIHRIVFGVDGTIVARLGPYRSGP